MNPTRRYISRHTCRNTHRPILVVRTLRAQAGVLLIEVLVGMLIFMVGVLGLIGLQGRSVTQSIEAQMRSQAAFVAQEFYSRMDSSITTAARGANLATYRGAITLAAPAIFTAWKSAVLQDAAAGLPNADATYDVVEENSSVALRLTITWQLRTGGTGPDATVQHRFVTQRPFI
jgi:type IV pilus assembly protein PilV